jgi:hypothetical protein
VSVEKCPTAVHQILCLSHFISNSLHFCDSCKCTDHRYLNTCYKTSKCYFIWLARLSICTDQLSNLCKPESPPLNQEKGNQPIIHIFLDTIPPTYISPLYSLFLFYSYFCIFGLLQYTRHCYT